MTPYGYDALDEPGFGTPRPSGRRRPSALAATTLVLVAALGAVVLWLALSAERTLAERRASIPAITVPVTLPDPGRLVDFALPEAPLPALAEPSSYGPLPRITDGIAPRTAYAKPFPLSDERARIAVILVGLGLDEAITTRAIEALPGAVTLALSPYSEDAAGVAARARRDGHEILVDLPLEPIAYPRHDPGPNTLLTSFPWNSNLARLHRTLASVPGAVGVIGLQGDRFVQSTAQTRQALDELAARGLLVVDATGLEDSLMARLAPTAGLPHAVAQAYLDEPTRFALATALDRALDTARRTGRAVVALRPNPPAIEQLRAWAPGLAEDGYVLAPVSAVAELDAPADGS